MLGIPLPRLCHDECHVSLTCTRRSLISGLHHMLLFCLEWPGKALYHPLRLSFNTPYQGIRAGSSPGVSAPCSGHHSHLAPFPHAGTAAYLPTTPTPPTPTAGSPRVSPGFDRFQHPIQQETHPQHCGKVVGRAGSVGVRSPQSHGICMATLSAGTRTCFLAERRQWTSGWRSNTPLWVRRHPCLHWAQPSTSQLSAD